MKYGAEILLDDLIVRLSADCPWRDEPRGSCGARFADLPPARPPDSPPAPLRLRVGEGREGLRDAIVGHFNGGSALKPQHGTRQPMMPVHLIRIGRSAQPVSLTYGAACAAIKGRGTSMEIKSEEPPCVGQWFSFWIVGAKGKTKIEARRCEEDCTRQSA